MGRGLGWHEDREKGPSCDGPWGDFVALGWPVVGRGRCFRGHRRPRHHCEQKNGVSVACVKPSRDCYLPPVASLSPSPRAGGGVGSIGGGKRYDAAAHDSNMASGSSAQGGHRRKLPSADDDGRLGATRPVVAPMGGGGGGWKRGAVGVPAVVAGSTPPGDSGDGIVQPAIHSDTMSVGISKAHEGRLYIRM